MVESPLFQKRETSFLQVSEVPAGMGYVGREKGWAKGSMGRGEVGIRTQVWGDTVDSTDSLLGAARRSSQ